MAEFTADTNNYGIYEFGEFVIFI